MFQMLMWNVNTKELFNCVVKKTSVNGGDLEDIHCIVMIFCVCELIMISQCEVLQIFGSTMR